MQIIFWLLAIIVSVFAGYAVFRRDKKRAVPYPWIVALLRSIVVFLTLLLVLMPTITLVVNVTEKPIIVLLQDNSRSIANALGADSATYRKNVNELATKLSEKYKVISRGFGHKIDNDSIFNYYQSTTDISSALANVQEFYGMQNLGAVILASDGRYNEGMNPLYQDIALHNPVYAVAIGDSSQQKDIKIAGIFANKVVTLNNTFEIRADIIAQLCAGYSNGIILKEDGKILSNIIIFVNSNRYDRPVSFTLKAEKAGLHHYIIEVPVAEGEKNTANNRKDIFIEIIDEKKNILIVSAAPHPDVNAIKEALTGLETYKVTICTADNFPKSLSTYNAIIMHGLPSIRYNFNPQLLAAKKPAWLILSNQTGYQILNDLRTITHTTVSPAIAHNILPVYSPAFNSFTVPKDIQTIIDKMPPLSANVNNILAAPGTTALLNQKTGVGEGQTPVWVLQQGTIPSAFLLGEGIWRWRMYEYKNFGNHNVIDECIRQTVAFLCANTTDKPFNVTLPKYVWSDQESINLVAHLYNSNHESINTPDVQITITDSAGHKQNFSFEKAGTAYNLNIGVWAGGTYTYTAHTNYNSINYNATGTIVVENTPLEFMETGADYPLLYGIAKKYNGAFVPATQIASLYDSIIHNEKIKPIIRSNTETIPLVERKWYFFLILLVAVVEWLLRKYWLAQ